MPKVDTRKAVAPMSGDEAGLSMMLMLEPTRASNELSPRLKFYNHGEGPY